MKTLEIKNGDLVIGSGGHATVSGPTKLRQDLSMAMREPYGSDRFHPRWGSLLFEYVGTGMDEYIQMQVISECQRVVGNYLGLQQELMASTTAAGRRPTFTSGEVVESIQDIQIRQTYDRLHVRIFLNTLSGESVSLVGTVGV